LQEIKDEKLAAEAALREEFRLKEEAQKACQK
jgi:hypothetical protein